MEIIGYIGALIVGLILGLIGGGGSILTVPILVYVLAFNPVIATAYSLFVVGITSVVGALQKYNNGLVDFKTGIAFSFPSFIAVYLSRRYLVPNIPETLFTIGSYSVTKAMSIMLFFALVMLFSSVAMIKKNNTLKLNHTKQAYYKTFTQGLAIGTVTGIIGAGGGFLYVPALVLWANISMKKAVGTSLVIIAINSLIGFIGDVQTLSIQWSFLIAFTAVAILGIVIGGQLSKHISGTKLKQGFGFFTLVMATYILYKEL